MFRLSAPTFSVLFPFPTARRVCIHMYFVFFSLDILWLDKDCTVIAQKTLKPWSNHTPKESATYILELPAGTCQSLGVRIGDTLKFEE